MTLDANVIFHIQQAEISHSPSRDGRGKFLTMSESEIFRENLLRAMQEQRLTAAELSRLAGLNSRAVKDIEERRVVSPKLSTVFALAKALNRDPGELLGLGRRLAIKAELAEFLSQYSPEDQERLLSAIRLIPTPPSAGK